MDWDNWVIFDGYVWCPTCNEPMVAETISEAINQAQSHQCSGEWMKF